MMNKRSRESAGEEAKSIAVASENSLSNMAVPIPASDESLAISPQIRDEFADKTSRPIVSQRNRWGIAILTALIMGVMPATALYVEHGDRMWWFMGTRPHFFYFSLLVAWHCLYFLIDPVATVWKYCLDTLSKWLVVVIVLLATSAACAYDFSTGFPGLFELKASVQDAPQYAIGNTEKHTLWDYDRNAEKLVVKSPDLRQANLDRLSELADNGQRSWVEYPYYVSMFLQIALGFLLTLLTWFTIVNRELLDRPHYADHLSTGSALFAFWFPMNAAFTLNKRLLYGDDPGSTQVIFWMAVILVPLGMTILSASEKHRSVKSIAPAVFTAALSMLSIAIFSDHLPQLFSREWRTEWYFIIYAFIAIPFSLVNQQRERKLLSSSSRLQTEPLPRLEDSPQHDSLGGEHRNQPAAKKRKQDSKHRNRSGNAGGKTRRSIGPSSAKHTLPHATPPNLSGSASDHDSPR